MHQRIRHSDIVCKSYERNGSLSSSEKASGERLSCSETDALALQFNFMLKALLPVKLRRWSLHPTHQGPPRHGIHTSSVPRANPSSSGRHHRLGLREASLRHARRAGVPAIHHAQLKACCQASDGFGAHIRSCAEARAGLGRRTVQSGFRSRPGAQASRRTNLHLHFGTLSLPNLTGNWKFMQVWRKKEIVA